MDIHIQLYIYRCIFTPVYILLTRCILTERVEILGREEEAVRAMGKEPERPFASPFYWAGFSVWGDGNTSGKHAETKAKKEGGTCVYIFGNKYVPSCGMHESKGQRYWVFISLAQGIVLICVCMDCFSAQGIITTSLSKNIWRRETTMMTMGGARQQTRRSLMT